MTIEFWLGGARRVLHDVPAKAVDECYALPKKGHGSDRFAYWRAVTGDDRITGHVLVWTTVEGRT